MKEPRPKEKEVTCAACGHCKRYRVEEFNSHLAACAKWLLSEHDRTKKEKIGVIEDTNSRTPRWIETKRLIHKLKYWNLLNPNHKARDGYVIVRSDKLRAFVKGEETVERYIHVSQDKYEGGASEERTTWAAAAARCGTEADWHDYLHGQKHWWEE